MPERTREESEQRVLETIRRRLPELTQGRSIEIEKVDPEEHDGAHFVVAESFPTFACRRGS